MYVDDFRMSGKTENLAPMWKKLGEQLVPEPAVPSHSNTYLGCNQRPVDLDEAVVKEKANLFTSLLKPTGERTIEEEKEDCKNTTQEPLKPKPKGKGKAKAKTRGSQGCNAVFQALGQDPHGGDAEPKGGKGRYGEGNPSGFQALGQETRKEKHCCIRF